MCAKSTLPFGGASATKSIGKSLTFYRRGNRQKVKSYGVPTGNPSEAQLSQQAYIRSKEAAWQALSASEKAEWNTRAKARGNPWYGYTLFMATMEAAMNFTELLDTFSSYVGKAGKIIQIKITEDGLEAVDPSDICGMRLGRLDVNEDFESLSLGNVDGQGSYLGWDPWAASTPANTSAEIIASGEADGQILRLERTAGTETVKAVLDFNDDDNDWGLRGGFYLRVKMRKSDITMGSGYFMIKTQSGDAMRFETYFSASSTFRFLRSGGASEQLWIPANNTWYDMALIYYPAYAQGYVHIFKDSHYLYSKSVSTDADFDLDRIEISLSNGDGAVTYDIAYLKVYNMSMPG